MATAATGAALATAGRLSPAIAQGRQTWKLASVWDPKSDLGQQLTAFAQQVTTQSNGSLALELFRPANPRQIIEQVANGDVPMGHGMPELWSDRVPATAYLMTVPFGLMAQEHYAWLKYGGGQALADRVYDRLGCKYFPGGNLGMQAGGWFKAEIQPPQGLNGLKMQSRGLAIEVLKAAGAQLFTFTADELPNALKRGDLDALDYLGPADDLDKGFYKDAPYYYFPGWQRPATMLDFFINPAAWDALSPGLQGILTATIESFNQTLLGYYLNQSSVAIATLIDQYKVQVRQFPEPILLRLESLAEEVLRSQASQDPLIQQILDSLIAFRVRMTPWSRTSLSSYLMTRRWSWNL
jgi:TRAP-type mannitol/chloroaromatic compound transport system substrate-binding protein